MAEIVNLRTRRKQAAREAGREKGAENAAKFGIPKVERELSRARAEKSAREHEGHKREGHAPEPE